MPHNESYDNEFDESYDDFNNDDEFDNDDSDTIACPQCSTDVYDDSPRCPVCGHYFTAADRRRGSNPWVRWVVLAMIVAMLLPFLLVLVRILAGN